MTVLSSLDEHGWTLLEGDCMAWLPAIARLSPPIKFDAVIADPPYGVAYQSRMRKKTGMFDTVLNDERPFIWFLYHAYTMSKDDSHLICFHNWKTQDIFRSAIEAAGYTIKGQLVWDKDVHGLGDLEGAFGSQHELAWHAVKGDPPLHSPKRPTTMLRVPRVHTGAYTHPTEKPVALLRWLIRAVCPVDGLILDPFLGSGSTMKAARLEKRRCVGMELGHEYAEQIRRAMAVEQATFSVEEVS